MMPLSDEFVRIALLKNFIRQQQGVPRGQSAAAPTYPMKVIEKTSWCYVDYFASYFSLLFAMHSGSAS